MLRTSVALVLIASLLAPTTHAAEPAPAAGIAAKVIRERAHELETRGQQPLAEQLRALADQLTDGSVSLSDAALVVQIALAGSAAPTAQALTPEQQHAAVAAATRATSILDGEPVPAAVAPVATKPPPAVHIDEKALAVPIATSVLIADWVGDPKSLLVMIGVGKDQHITQGQHFVVQRGEQKLAVISATQVKEASTICIAIPGTLAEGAQIKPGDAVVSE